MPLWSNLILLHYTFDFVFLSSTKYACEVHSLQHNLFMILLEKAMYLLFSIQPPADALFAHPRLFRACIPPGMHRFRGNVWDYDSRPRVMQILGYPLEMTDRIPEITEARNVELGLGLQVAIDASRFSLPFFLSVRFGYTYTYEYFNASLSKKLPCFYCFPILDGIQYVNNMALKLFNVG